MLVNKVYDSGDIVAFKLVNGDEIVAKVVSEDMISFKINRPCTIVPSPQGLGLMQSMFSSDINKDIELRKEHVMMHAPVIKQMSDHYFQTTTGIQPVTKGSLIM
jgi:hypothetical protein